MRRYDLREYGPDDRVFRAYTVAQLRSLVDGAPDNLDAIDQHTIALAQDELDRRSV